MVPMVNWSPTIDMGMFEEKGKIYPKVVNLNVDFTVLHEGDMGWVGGKFQKAEFPFGG